MKPVPLVDYWLAKMALDSVQPTGFRAPPLPPSPAPSNASGEDLKQRSKEYEKWSEEDQKWRCEYEAATAPRAEAEITAWRKVCEEAACGKIKIKAYRHVSSPEYRAWYPDFPESNLLEDIPAEFFADHENIMISPTAPVVIYYTDRRLGGIFSAPWSDPCVADSHSVRMVPSGKAIKDFLKERSDLPRDALEKAVKDEFGPGLRDTVRGYSSPRKLGRPRKR
jgi:hypothetical protein